MTYKGNMYQAGSLSDQAALALEFSAGTVTVPSLTRFQTVVTVPFTVNRGVFLTDLNRANTIAGQGFASVLFQSVPFDEHTNAWVAGQVRYDFSRSTPVPSQPRSARSPLARRRLRAQHINAGGAR